MINKHFQFKFFSIFFKILFTAQCLKIKSFLDFKKTQVLKLMFNKMSLSTFTTLLQEIH